ncbi:hypothetical protein [Halobacillus litoralis]|uniref:hypothetical protein n=1 Tax=Halobacillus litoralis TaxID=45668 RepID=UPI001CFF1611|nr:hypothetical protein [Halobacillus litoralis]
MVRTSFCHCFSNQEELMRGITTKRSYLAFCVVTGEKGAIEFSFKTTYPDTQTKPPFTTFYGVTSEMEEDESTPKKMRIHTKEPLKNDNQNPQEKPFLRCTERYYSYSVDLDLYKLQSMKDNPDPYLKTIHSKELYDEMSAIYSNIFKMPPIAVEGNHFVVLVD